MNDPRPQVAGVFDRSAPTYDSVGVTFFADVGDRLVDVASLQPGERVVDMGCGRGAALFPAATAVGPTGSVHGLDIAATMVDLTRGEILLRGLTNVTVEVGDAQQPDLPRRDYDVVLSSLAVFFLPDPGAGLRAWRAATAEGGRLAVSTFADRNDERWAWLEEVLPSRNPSATSPGATKDAPGPFQTAELLHELLSTSGWVGGSSTEVEHTLRFADPDQWVRWSWSHGMRTYWERLDDDGRLAAEDRARAELRRMESEPEGLTLRMRLRYTTASAAG
jgi:ubiquinone/menaquinone biosynthesis C-methylase UbiE